MDSDIYNPCKQLQKSSFLLKNLSFARKAGEMTLAWLCYSSAHFYGLLGQI